MSKKDIMKALRKIAKRDNLKAPSMLKVGDEGVLTMFLTDEGFPPFWYRSFTFEQLKAIN